jgi:hypothetical protein
MSINMMQHQESSDAEKVCEVRDARNALAVALREAGIQLPALDVALVGGGASAGTEAGEGGARYGLVELGQCAAPVAHALAAVVAKGAGA